MSRSPTTRGDESSWEPIQRSLDSYQPERMATLLREYLTPRVPPGTRKLSDSLRKELQEGVEALLEANLGPWYNKSGVRLGNGVVGGFCWCHRFFNQKPLPELNVEHNVQTLMKALNDGHAWLSTLDAAFRSAELVDDEDPAIRQMALSDAVVRIIDIAVKFTGTEDAWYGYAYSAVEWLLEARDVRLTSEVRKALRDTVGKFESWIGPTEEQSRAAGDAIALAAVRTAFDARYPGGK